MPVFSPNPGIHLLASAGQREIQFIDPATADMVYHRCGGIAVGAYIYPVIAGGHAVDAVHTHEIDNRCFSGSVQRYGNVGHRLTTRITHRTPDTAVVHAHFIYQRIDVIPLHKCGIAGGYYYCRLCQMQVLRFIRSEMGIEAGLY